MKKNMTIKNSIVLDAIQDKATVTNNTHSAVIEDALSTAFFSGNPYAESIYKNGVKETLLSIFQPLSAGMGFKADDTYFPLVKLALDIVSLRKDILGVDCNYADLGKGHLQSNYETINSILEAFVPNYSNDELKNVDLENFSPYPYLSEIVENWEVLKDTSYTYRLLYDVVALSRMDFWNNLHADLRLYAKNCVAIATAEWRY